MDFNTMGGAAAPLQDLPRWATTSTDSSAATDANADALNFWDDSSMNHFYTTQDTVNTLDSFDFSDDKLFFQGFDSCIDGGSRIQEIHDDNNIQSSSDFTRDVTPTIQDPQPAAQVDDMSSFDQEWIASFNNGNDNSVKDRLNAAMIPGDGGHLFLPADSLKTILTSATVTTELERLFPAMSVENVSRLANNVATDFLQIFAVLILFDHADRISDFLDGALNDTSLPVIKVITNTTPDGAAQFELCHKDAPDTELRCFSNWSQAELDIFEKLQWRVMIPVFSPILAATATEEQQRVGFLDLDDKVVLPFTESTESAKHDHYKGGYSEVFRVKIHPAHQHFHEAGGDGGSSHFTTSFAVKKLVAKDEDTFRREVEVLQRLANAEHPNVVSLLATYKYKGSYHLVFPWADGDLRRLWQSQPDPQPGKEEARWLATQCAGIASALKHVHNGADKWLKDPAAAMGDSLISPRQMWGLHGDIKPENIFVFSRGPQKDSSRKALTSATPCLRMHGGSRSNGGTNPTTDCYGNNNNEDLVIGDFGGGVFYDPTSGPDPLRSITTAYRPPEYDTRLRPVSRSFDVWSLACTYLEFVTWFLEGSVGLNEFARRRMTVSGVTGKVSDEYFETFGMGADGRVGAILKGSVLSWINDLYRHKNSSQFIRDFLDFITHRMFIVETELITRASSDEVSSRLNDLANQCFRDESYCLPSPSGPTPWDVQSLGTVPSIPSSSSAANLSMEGVSAVDFLPTPQSFDTNLDLLNTWQTAPAVVGDETPGTVGALGMEGVSFATTPVTSYYDGSSAASPERKRKRSVEEESSPSMSLSPFSLSPPFPASASSSSSLPERRVSTKTSAEDTAPASSSRTAGGKRFACPYYKSSPSKFRHKRTCCGPGWPTVHRVKEHLYRCHTIGKHTCSRCLLKCKGAAELLRHQRAAVPCQTRTDAFAEGTMTPSQEEALRVKKRVPPNTTEEQRWYEVYGILFADGDPGGVPSPFYEDETAEGSRGGQANELDPGGVVAPDDFEKYLSRGLSPDIQRELEREIQREFGFVGNSAQTRKVVDMVQKLQLRLFRHYEQSRGSKCPRAG